MNTFISKMIDTPSVSTKEEFLVNLAMTEKELEKMYDTIWKRYETLEALEEYYQTNGISEYQYQVAELLMEMRVVLNQLKGYVGEKESTKEKTERLKRKVGADLEAIDYFFSEDVSNLFQAYWQSNNPSERIHLLNTLRRIYLADNRTWVMKKREKMRKIHTMIAHIYHLNLKTTKGKRKLHEIMKKKEFLPICILLEDWQERTKKGAKCIYSLNRLLSLEKSAVSKDYPIELEDEEELSLLFHQTKSEFDKKFLACLTDLRTSQYLARYSTSLLTETPKEIIQLFKELETLEEDEQSFYATFAKGVIRNRRRVMRQGIFIGMDIELAFLQRMEKAFESFIKKEEEEIDTSIYYKMMMALLSNDGNVFYIKQLLSCNKGFLNARINESILFFLLDEFIHNYKLKLVDQGFVYQDPVFYREVICLFFEKGAHLEEEEKRLFVARLEEFEQYLQQRKYFHSPEVLNDISRILASFKQESQEEETRTREKQSDYLNKNTIQAKVYDYKREGKRLFWNKGMETFQIEGIDSYLFSLETKEDGREILYLHLFDTSEFIESKSPLAMEMKKGRELDLSFQPGLEYPCRTFEYDFSLDGNRSKVKTYPSVVTYDDVYTDQDIASYRKNPVLKQLFGLFHRVVEEKGEMPYHTIEELTTFLSSFLGESLMEEFQKREIPFVYQKQLEQEDEFLLSNYNKVCHLLSFLPRKEAHEIFTILMETKKNYYVNEQEEGTMLECNSNTYLGLLLLEHLQKIEKKRFDREEEKKATRQIQKELNEQRGYLPSSYFTKKEAEKVKKLGK